VPCGHRFKGIGHMWAYVWSFPRVAIR